jgi:hypothetical protein
MYGIWNATCISRPPLWSSSQSSWLQIQRSRFVSQCYQICWEVVSLEWGPLSLVSTTEELFWRKSSGSCLESQEYGQRNLSSWPHGTLYPQKLALTSPTSGGRSVGIVHSHTQVTEFSLYAYHELVCCLEICQWCGEPCIAGAAVSLDGYLPHISRGDRYRILQT